MSSRPVVLDFTKAQPIDKWERYVEKPEQPVTLDFSRAQPIDKWEQYVEQPQQQPSDNRSWWQRAKDDYAAVKEHPGEALLGAAKQVPGLIQSAMPQASNVGEVDPEFLRTHFPKAYADQQRWKETRAKREPNALEVALDRVLTPQTDAQQAGSDAANIAAIAANLPMLARSLGKAGLSIKPLRPVAGKLATAASDIIDPEITGILSPRLAHLQKVLGRLGYALSKEEPVYPGATLPRVPSEAQLNQASPYRNVGPLRSKLTSPEAIQARAIDAVTPESAPAPQVTRAQVEQQLGDALGAKPLQRGVPLRQQATATEAAGAPALPKGFTASESSALKGYKYDAAKQELETVSTNGQHYIHGDVSPEQFAEFESAKSTGKAWNSLRQNSVLVAKVINGKRIAVKPSAKMLDLLNPQGAQ